MDNSVVVDAAVCGLLMAWAAVVIWFTRRG
jgi:hypothetical protein